MLVGEIENRIGDEDVFGALLLHYREFTGDRFGIAPPILPAFDQRIRTETARQATPALRRDVQHGTMFQIILHQVLRPFRRPERRGFHGDARIDDNLPAAAMNQPRYGAGVGARGQGVDEAVKRDFARAVDAVVGLRQSQQRLGKNGKSRAAKDNRARTLAPNHPAKRNGVTKIRLARHKLDVVNVPQGNTHNVRTKFGKDVLNRLTADLAIVHVCRVSRAVQRRVEVRQPQRIDRVRLVAAVLADQQNSRSHPCDCRTGPSESNG